MNISRVKGKLRDLVAGPRPPASSAGQRAAGGQLADAGDLLRPEFGAPFRARFEDRGLSIPPRKLWELSWLAERHEEISRNQSAGSMLGLGVGHEPLIFHFACLAGQVVATDLYDEKSDWDEARLREEAVFAASPFPYPRERLTVRNMDMRSIRYPAESFHTVWSCSSVEHVMTLSELIRIFAEVHRVLKPGGHALITTEFSLRSPYFLPGVLSLWKDCALFAGQLEGLSLAGPVDLLYRGDFPGNQPAPRSLAHRVSLLNDLGGGPSGVCIHVGYAQVIPVALVFEKTGDKFRWPERLGAPSWYADFSAGLEAAQSRQFTSSAERFRAALDSAADPGARLHCFWRLLEAHVQAGQVRKLKAAIRECVEAMPSLPADDDAMDAIAFIAAGQGELAFAQRCWERAQACPAALPTSRLRIRCNQLAAELEAHGPSWEASHLGALADAAWCEAVDFPGPANPQVIQLAERLAQLRRAHGLRPLLSASPSSPAALSAPKSVTPRHPDFDFADPPPRPLVYLGGNRALTKTVYGQKMYVDTQSQVGACFLLDGYWEEWIVRHLKEYVKPGMNVLDLGANMGFYTLLLCELVGPEGHVTAFEPWPDYHELLVRNVELNGYSGRCTVVRKAVCESSGTRALTFYRNAGTGTLKGGEAFFEQHGIAVPASETPVETVSLDDYLAANPRDIAFIKMDVDGSEPFVFQGMQSLLGRGGPLAIFCEFCPVLLRSVGVDAQSFLDELRGARFAISHIAPGGIRPVGPGETLQTADWEELLLVRE